MNEFVQRQPLKPSKGFTLLLNGTPIVIPELHLIATSAIRRALLSPGGWETGKQIVSEYFDFPKLIRR
jgi:hypothetical protein